MEMKGKKLTFAGIAVGFGLLVFGEIFARARGGHGLPDTLIFVVSYLILGLPVFGTAIRKLWHKNIFNEYVLYSLGTLGCFLLGQTAEAAAILFIFRLAKLVEEALIDSLNGRLHELEGRLSHPLNFENRPRTEMVTDRFSRYFVPALVAIALAIVMLPSVYTGNWIFWAYIGLTFILISYPGALLLSVPLAFRSSIGQGAREGIYFRGGRVLENLGRVRTVVLNKTGIVTEGSYRLEQIIPYGKFSPNDLLRLCASCEFDSRHPIALCIVGAAREGEITLLTPSSLEKLPGYGVKGTLSFGEVLCGNRKLLENYDVSLENLEHNIFDTEVFVSVGGIFAGYLSVSEIIKPDAKKTVTRLKQQGLTVAMFTGDTWDSARAVAKETGIEEVFAKLLPEEKLEELGNMRKRRGRLMFVGNGIFDERMLGSADVGCAFEGKSDIVPDEADLIISRNLDQIPKSITVARKMKRFISLAFILSLGVKLAIVCLGFLGFASMWLAAFADLAISLFCVIKAVRIYPGKEE